MKTIVCAIQKGGQGKTMLATHLAFYAAELGKRVLVVDLDTQGNFTSNLTVTHDKTAAPAFGLFEGKRRPALPLKLNAKKKGSIAAFTGSRQLVEVDETPEIKAGSLKKMLAHYTADYDVCIIDPPPTLGKRLAAALIASNFVVMPFVPSRESLDGLGDLMDTIEEHKQSTNPTLRVIGLLANKVNSRSKDQQSIIAQIKAAAPGMMLPMQINERTSICGTLGRSKPVWDESGGASQRLAAQETRKACSHILSIVLKA